MRAKVNRQCHSLSGTDGLPLCFLRAACQLVAPASSSSLSTGTRCTASYPACTSVPLPSHHTHHTTSVLRGLARDWARSRTQYHLQSDLGSAESKPGELKRSDPVTRCDVVLLRSVAIVLFSFNTMSIVLVSPASSVQGRLGLGLACAPCHPRPDPWPHLEPARPGAHRFPVPPSSNLNCFAVAALRYPLPPSTHDDG